MFLEIKSDITTVTNGIIAHGVNCQGKFGAGVALAIRNKWPAVYNSYILNSRPIMRSAENIAQLLGSCHMIRVSPTLWVANCYTQLNYGNDGKRYASPEAIRRSLEFVFSQAAIGGSMVHLPRIGAGLGGLDWESEVLPIFEELYNEYDGTVPVTVHSL
jgi:O-acetyl-ADP-ribose deacetylase (regulator of RNase III)